MDTKNGFFTLAAALLAGTALPAWADPNISYQLASPGAQGYDRVEFPITVLAAPFTGANYYFALQSNFVRDVLPNTPGAAMYIGLQPREAGRNLVIFSTFGSGTTALSSNCRAGADGGSGTSCSLRYEWKLNTPYLLSMVKDAAQSTAASSVWAGYIKNLTTLDSIEIGRFAVPAARLGLNSQPYHFNEYFPFNRAEYKDATLRPCVEYSQLRVSAPSGFFNAQAYATTKVLSVRQNTGKDSCAISQGKLNNRVTPIPGTFDYLTETGILSK
jgi:hypothetical protein